MLANLKLDKYSAKRKKTCSYYLDIIEQAHVLHARNGGLTAEAHHGPPHLRDLRKLQLRPGSQPEGFAHCLQAGSIVWILILIRLEPTLFFLR